MIRIQDINYKYDQDWVLNHLSLTVERGSFLGLIGPNGSGKTTLLKVLSGLLIPQSGTQVYQDRVFSSWPLNLRARSIAYVPQENHFLYPYTALEVVLMGRSPYTSLFGFDRPVDLKIAQNALGRVGLARLSHRMIQTLSGGERQLVVMARALAQEPELLLLDEPTAFLDLSHQVQIYQILKTLNQTEGLTIISVSHDLNLAAQYCTTLLLLKGGEVRALGEPSTVLTETLLEEVYGCRTLVDPHPITHKPRITLVPDP